AARGTASRKQLEALWAKVQEGELPSLDAARLKDLGRKAGNEVRRKVDDWQSRVIQVTGMATRSELKELSREISKLSKKIDAAIGPRTKRNGKRPELRG